MKLFIGMLIAMGIHYFPQLEDYWSWNPLLAIESIVADMPYKRFKVLLICLHLVDNNVAVARGQPGFEKLFKIRYFLNTLVTNIYPGSLQPS